LPICSCLFKYILFACKVAFETRHYNISEVLSLLQKYKQKMQS
jgi:hypothetical protein